VLRAGAGATPHLGIGLGALAAVVFDRLELGLAGRYWLERDQLALADDPARPAHRIGRQQLELFGCYTLLRSAQPELGLAACLAPGATRVSAEAVRVSGGPAERSQWSPSLSLGMLLRYFPFRRVFIGLAPALTWARGAEFQLEVNRDDQPVYRSRDVFFCTSLETGLRF
jgi:hypothetical protein